MVRVRELHPVSGDSDLRAEEWAERFGLCEREREQLVLACSLADAARNHTGNPEYAWSPEVDCYSIGLEMADILRQMYLDVPALVAAILYRSVREERLTLEAVRDAFGDEVTRLVDGVLQMVAIGRALHPTREVVLGQSQSQVDNIRRMLVTLIDDVRVAMIKLAERTCALRALKNKPERARRVAREVFDVFVPLAHRLGVGYLKWELEDLSFRYLEPESYSQVAKLLDGRRMVREQYIDQVKATLTEELARAGIRAELQGRVKHIYSIWRKMQRKGIAFAEVYDIRAVRILVDTQAECYAALGTVHSLWRTIPREFDDYIANPKPNGYQSLHTAVIGPEGKALEVQIRTHRMHAEAEFGVCAHWAYKGSDKASLRADSYEKKIAWLRQVLAWHESLGSVEGLEELTAEVGQDRIYTFTPKGHVVDLPLGSTPVDFAYHIHTQVGHRCRGARVDGRIVPLTYQLSTGEQVEILTADEPMPNRNWLRPDLGYTHSSRTRGKIQEWFRHLDRDHNLAVGRQLVEREFAQLALTSLDFKEVATQMRFATVEDMYVAVGAGDVTPRELLDAAQRMLQRSEARQLDFAGFDERAPGLAANDIRVQGVGSLLTVIAGCCNPLPGDEITGFVSHGRGVEVHKPDCRKFLNLQASEPARVISVQWGQQSHTFPVVIAVAAFDRQGLLRDITSLLAQEKVNVIGLNTHSDKETHIASMKITAEVTGLESLSRLLSRIAQLPNVVSVARELEG